MRRVDNIGEGKQTPIKEGRNMSVFVKNIRGESLMPCSPRKARLLLRERKAKVINYTPLTITDIHSPLYTS